MEIQLTLAEEAEELADLRVAAMRESLMAVGRFDPLRARNRFLSTFSTEATRKIIVNNQLAGFYVLREHTEHLCLEHLYVHPEYQGCGVGSSVMSNILAAAALTGKRIVLGALKGSRANAFYQAHGFVLTDTAEFDNYYEYNHPA